MKPVYILSKERAEVATTPKMLGDVPFVFVVEPHDAQAYRDAYPEIPLVVMDADHKGLGYARAFTHDWARAQGQDWHWQLDDNISELGMVARRRVTKSSAAEVLSLAESAIGIHDRVALVGLQYWQYAWSAKRQYSWNRMVNCAMLVRADVNCDYGRHMVCKQDIAYFLDVVLAGHLVVRWETLAMRKAKMASWKVGGLVREYEQRVDEKFAKLVADEYGDLCRLVEKRGRIDVAINWRRLDKVIGTPKV